MGGRVSESESCHGTEAYAWGFMGIFYKNKKIVKGLRVVFYLQGFMLFQNAEESAVPSNAGLDITETTVNLDDTISPLSNAQLAAAAVAPSTSVMADNASTLASLRMVY